MKRITVRLVDDGGIARPAIRKVLNLEADLEVVGEAKNGREAVALVKKLRPEPYLCSSQSGHCLEVIDGCRPKHPLTPGIPVTRNPVTERWPGF